MRYFLLMMLCLFANAAFAQAVDDALQRGQRKAGAAYSDLQKAEYETKSAEEEFRKADVSHKTAQKQADDLKPQADAAAKKLAAAKAKEAAVRKTYDAAVDAVDKISHPASKK